MVLQQRGNLQTTEPADAESLRQVVLCAECPAMETGPDACRITSSYLSPVAAAGVSKLGLASRDTTDPAQGTTVRD